MQFADQSLSELAIAIPMATVLFRKNRLDFCCGGMQTLREACQNGKLNLESIVEELTKLKSAPGQSFDKMPLSEMTSYIVKRYHDDLRRRLPELLALSHKVEQVHAGHEDCPDGLHALLTEMHNELQMHMMKEENVLFPMIAQGRGSMAFMPIKVMNAEHEGHGRQLDDLRRLTNNFKAPEGACGTWRALFAGAEKLEEELMEHIHLENNVLFPGALSESV